MPQRDFPAEEASSLIDLGTVFKAQRWGEVYEIVFSAPDGKLYRVLRDLTDGNWPDSYRDLFDDGREKVPAVEVYEDSELVVQTVYRDVP